MTQIPKLRDFDNAEFNPFMEEHLMFGATDDPYAALARLREDHPVQKGKYRDVFDLAPDITMPQDVDYFMVLGYEEVREALVSPHIFSNKAYMFNLGASFGRSVSTMDGEEHARFRRIFQKIFLPQFVRKWGTAIVDPVVDDLMEAFIHTGRADLIKQFTLHYPFGVIYRQLDLPSEEGKVFHKLAVAQTLISMDRAIGTEASDKLGEYFPKVIAARREQPGDDLVSLLANTEVDGEYLPEDVLVSFFRQLINAAGDTTYRGTSVLLTKLMQDPEQLELLRNDRSLMSNAIEEAIRYDGPVIEQSRIAACDTELAGVKIPKGSIVHLVAGAANRDPRKFENPDKFDITRENASRHFGFSGGPHICIGQHLARVEMTRAVTAILDKLHNLRLDPDMPPPRITGAMMRVPEHLHVRFDPA